MTTFLNDIILHNENDIQFKNSSGSNAGKISQVGDDLVLSNAVGDILLGNGSDDIFIGDGTNTVDIRFEQDMAIFADSSSTRTLTLGGVNTNLALESPTVSGTMTLGTTTINNKLTFTTTNGYILFDYEPSTGSNAEYSNEVPLLKVDREGTELTVMSRLTNNGALAIGIDDTVAIVAGDTKSVIKSNINYTSENVVFAAEGGFFAYGFPGNDTTWSNRNEFRFKSDSSTASDNGLYIGDGGNTQFIDLSRNLKNIGTISSGAITSSGQITGTELEGTSLDINGSADIAGNLVVDGGQITIDTDAAGTSLVWKESDSSTVAGQLRGYANRGDIYLFKDGVQLAELSPSNDSFIPALHIGGTAAASGGVLQTTGNVNIDGDADISGATALGSTLTVTGNITANGNIIGDDSTAITNISSIGADTYAADADSTTRFDLSSDEILCLIQDEDCFSATTSSTTFHTKLIAKNRVLAKTTNSDANFDGDIVYFGGTTSMDAGKIYYLNSSGNWALADADAESTAKGMLGVALGAASDLSLIHI